MECGFYVYKGLLCEICSYGAAFTQKCFWFLVRGSGYFRSILPAAGRDLVNREKWAYRPPSKSRPLILKYCIEILTPSYAENRLKKIC